MTGELAWLGGATKVTVDLVPGPVRVTADSDAPLPEQAVAAALDQAGGYRLAGA